MKYFKLGLPIFVVVSCVWCLVLSIMESNYMGTMGYITALFGWLSIAYSEYVDYRIKK